MARVWGSERNSTKNVVKVWGQPPSTLFLDCEISFRNFPVGLTALEQKPGRITLQTVFRQHRSVHDASAASEVTQKGYQKDRCRIDTVGKMLVRLARKGQPQLDLVTVRLDQTNHWPRRAGQ